MKKLLAPFLLFSCIVAGAQRPADEVLNAEKSFAAYSVQNGTTAAFLKFADSSGLVFEGGKAVNAIEVWSKRGNGSGVLNWHPIYGFMAASGDLGFTTGPWTFQSKTTQDSVLARGQYSTVWHKTVGGEWKFLLDLGIADTPNFDSASFNFSNKKIDFKPGNLADLQKAEDAFVQNTKDAVGRKKTYAASISKQVFLLNRNDRLPVVTVNDVDALMTTMPQSIAYKQAGAGISKSGDLGYVYGTTTINNKEEGYLRIWRREGTEWKLALEVLRY